MAKLFVRNEFEEKEIELKSKNYNDSRIVVELFEIDHMLLTFGSKEEFLKKAKEAKLIDDSFNEVAIKASSNSFEIEIEPIFKDNYLKAISYYLYHHFNEENNIIPLDVPEFKEYFNEFLNLLNSNNGYNFANKYIDSTNIRCIIKKYFLDNDQQKINSILELKKHLGKYENFRKLRNIIEDYKKEYNQQVELPKEERKLAIVLDKDCTKFKTLISGSKEELDDYIITNFNNSDEIRNYYCNEIEQFLSYNKDYLDKIREKSKPNYRGSIVLLEKKLDGKYERKRILYSDTLRKIKSIFCNIDKLKELAKGDYHIYKIFSEYEQRNIYYETTSYKAIISKHKKDLIENKKYDDIRLIFKSLNETSTKKTIRNKVTPKYERLILKQEIEKAIKEHTEEYEQFLDDEEIDAMYGYDDNLIVDKSQNVIRR